MLGERMSKYGMCEHSPGHAIPPVHRVHKISLLMFRDLKCLQAAANNAQIITIISQEIYRYYI